MHKLRKKYISFITLITLVVGTMTPFYASYSKSFSNTTRELAETLGSKILICTNDGFRWVSIKELENEQNAPSDQYKCPLCYIKSNNHNYVGTRHVSFLKPSSYYRKIVHSITNDLSFLSKYMGSSASSRAPPFSFEA